MIEDKIREIGIVPVIKIDDVRDAKPLAHALIEGGLPCAEVTFRTEAAAEAIAAMRSEYPSMLVGAGTVLTKKQVDDALQAGAQFMVSPGLNPEIVRYCQEKAVPIFPGCANASDLEAALALGLEVVKFFPAEVNGGINAIKALAAPYTTLNFMPTGGVNAGNLNDYLSLECVIACGGTWMVKDDLIKTKQFDVIETLTREAVQTLHGFEIAHIGINPETDSATEAAAFADLISGSLKRGKSSIFVDDMIEVMHETYRGTHGHIALRVNNLDRAMAYFTSKGYSFDATTEKEKDGKRIAIYLSEEFSGFAVHLLQK